MGSKSNYLELALLDHVLGGGAYTQPATVWIAFLSAVPSDTGGGTELVVGTSPGYARIAITNDATNFPAATTAGGGKGEKKLGVAAATPNNSGAGNWLTIVAWAMYDASTGGNLLLWGEIAPLAVTPGANANIPVNTVIWRED